MDATSTEWTQRLTTVRRGWELVLLCALAVTTVALLVAARTPDDVRATGRLIVAPSTAIEADFSISDTVRVLTQGGVMGTLAEMLESRASAERTVETLGLSDRALDDYEVVSQEVAGSMILEVHAEGPRGSVAEQLATGAIDDATALFGELYPVYEVRVLEPVRTGEPPSAGPFVQVGILGAIVGTGLGVVALLLWHELRAATGAAPQVPSVGAAIARWSRTTKRRRRPPIEAPSAPEEVAAPSTGGS